VEKELRMEQKVKRMEKDTKRRFLHIGIIKKTDTSRWKITQNEDVSIQYFISEVARLAANSAARQIHWYSDHQSKQISIELAIEQKMKEVIEAIIAKDYPK
jgi:hypothetical protein